MAETALLTEFVVKIDGSPMSRAMLDACVGLSVESSLHLPSVATIVFDDPELKWIDDASLGPGKKIIIEAREPTGPTGPSKVFKEIFDGEIVEIEPEFTQGAQRVTIRAFDRLHRLARGDRTRTLLKKTLGDMLSQVARDCGLKAVPHSSVSTEMLEYVCQIAESDQDFLRRFASLYGYLVYVKKQELHLAPVNLNGSAIQMPWAQNLLEFRPRLSTIDQADEAVVRSWDAKEKREIVGRSTAQDGSPQTGAGKGGPVAHSAFGMTTKDETCDVPVPTQKMAGDLAAARMDERTSRFIEAEATCVGNPDVVAGAVVQFTGVGTRFGGRYLVTRARHELAGAEGGYATSFSVSGVNPSTLAAILSPNRDTRRMPGLVIGLVSDAKDPENLGRVKVKFPWLGDSIVSDWARIASLGAGKTRGIEFIPEVNDEVLVGFEHGDLHRAFVLGGLWNKHDPLPRPQDQIIAGDGQIKERVIWSRDGHRIVFTDGEKPGIKIQDSKGNVVLEIDEQGQLFKVTSKKNIELHATADVVVQASANVKVTASANVEVTATGNMTLKATGQMKITGTGGVDIDSPGLVNVKGSMINLN